MSVLFFITQSNLQKLRLYANVLFQASTVCWKQNSDCFSSAGPTGSKNCNIWTANANGYRMHVQRGSTKDLQTLAGISLQPYLCLSMPPPESAPSASGSRSLHSISLMITTSPSSSPLYSSISSSISSSTSSSVSGTAAPPTQGTSSTSADPSSPPSFGPHLNVTAFFQRNCAVPVNGNNSVIVPAGRCSEWGNNTSPNDPVANPIPNGYVSCCYYFDGVFSSLYVRNSNLEAYNNCTITKFNGWDCDNSGKPETVGSLDAAESCFNTFYDTGAVGAPSNNEPAFAFRVDCITGNLLTSSASATQGGPGTVSTSTS